MANPSLSATNNNVGFLKTFFNSINALSGVGILSTPYALSSGGWLSLILLLVVAAASCFTGILIQRCMASDPLIATYTDVARVAFGRKGTIIATATISLELYLIGTGLLVLEGDNLHKLAPNFKLKLGALILNGRNSFILVATAVILPSTLLTDLGIFSYVSFMGMACTLVIIVCVFCVGTTKEVGFHEKGKLLNVKGLPMAVSLYLFCYGSHALFPTIYASMKNKTQFSKVLILGFIVCTAANAFMATQGYLMYGQNVQSQITLNLPKEKLSSKVAIYTILAGPLAKYALVIMPVSSALASCLPMKYKDSKLVVVLIRLLLLFSTMFLALLVPSFESVISLIGAALIVVVSFLLPCGCYLKIFNIHKKFGYELVGIVGIMWLSLIVGGTGTYSSISNTIKQT
ncbi:hypothetical protein NMG60_11013012 [Bertholletia excelsa]